GRRRNERPGPSGERSEVVRLLEAGGQARADPAPPFSGVGRVAIPLERLRPAMIAEEATRGVLTPELVPVPLRIAFCIAVIAAGRDLHAAPPGIERVIGPFDLRRTAHCTNLLTFTPSAFAPDRLTPAVPSPSP